MNGAKIIKWNLKQYKRSIMKNKHCIYNKNYVNIDFKISNMLYTKKSVKWKEVNFSEGLAHAIHTLTKNKL